MKTKRYLLSGVMIVALLASTTAVLAGTGARARAQGGETTLVQAVRDATENYQDPEDAEADGYMSMLACVSGPLEGAMGLHYIDPVRVGDSNLDAQAPEAIIYEPQADGGFELLGVEYIVLAETWHANNDMPPALLGQLFNFVPSPNRYGLPPFYELHVWAWRENPNGMFADYNPDVTCENYAVEETTTPPSTTTTPSTPSGSPSPRVTQPEGTQSPSTPSGTQTESGPPGTPTGSAPTSTVSPYG